MKQVTKRFTVRFRENGEWFEQFDRKEDAITCLKAMEVDDKREQIYEPDVYEVYDNELEEIVM
jgi:hypothetical protein